LTITELKKKKKEIFKPVY